MPYPGVVFAVVLGVAVGAAFYYYFCNEEEKPQKHRQFTHDRPSRSESTERKISCSICLDEMTVTTQVRALSCGHVFHYGCITKWISCQKSCPICRTRQSYK